MATDYGPLPTVVIEGSSRRNPSVSPNDEGYARQVSVLVVTDERFLDHRPGRRHPERPARLEAVWSGLKSAGLEDALVCREPQPAADEDLLRCHPSDHLAALVEIDAAGGGLVDADTVMSPGSWSAARLAAGALHELLIGRLG